MRGRVPDYLPEALTGFRNDRAMCAGVWLPSADRGMVPQGLVVAGRTAWVSGFDGTAPVGRRRCVLERVDLRTGERLARVGTVEGAVGDRPPVSCHHGGGLASDRHGLWLVETQRLWLLDSRTAAVRRVWALLPPVRGSFGLVDGEGRLGIGGFAPDREGRLFWFDPARLVASAEVEIGRAAAVGVRRTPVATQGAVWGALDGRRAAVWFARSATRCGVLVGPSGARPRAFLPGAEGMALAGHRLWVVSEAAARLYHEMGDRPVVPHLAAFDVSGFHRWQEPDCSV